MQCVLIFKINLIFQQQEDQKGRMEAWIRTVRR